MVKALRHICIIIENINDALKFYVDLLGLTVTKQEILWGKYPSALFGIKNIKITYIKLQLNKNNTEIELCYFHNPKYKERLGLGHFAITVDDIKKEYRRLKRAGVLFLSSPQTAPDNPCKVCFCYDPDFNLIELVEDLK